MKKLTDTWILLIVLVLIAVFFAYNHSPAATTAISPSPTSAAILAQDFDIGGVRLDCSTHEAQAVLGNPVKDRPGYWEYSGEDTARVQTLYFEESKKRVTCVTGSALSLRGKLICQTGTQAKEVVVFVGKPEFAEKRNSEAENAWIYNFPWGSVEIHMDNSNAKVLHSRLNLKT
jgi:hypothetical protein